MIHLEDLSLLAIRYFGRFVKLALLLYITGFLNSKPPYILQINYVLKISLSLFLIYRFNSYRKEKITISELDQKIIFSIGVYVLLFSFSDMVSHWTEEIRSFIIKYKPKVYGFLLNKTIVPYK
jgi:hypothetical protein